MGLAQGDVGVANCLAQWLTTTQPSRESLFNCRCMSAS